MKRVFSVMIVCLLWSVPAWAQFETASVVGSARDKTSGVMAGVKVTLTNRETGVSTEQVTDKDGQFEFVTVKPGVYVVTGEQRGFAVAVVDNLTVQVGARTRVDLVLSVGAVSETIKVQAETTLLERDSSQRGQVIDGDTIRQLALNGREYSMLALLSPGVRLSALNKSTNGTPREGAFNVNGLRSVFNNFLIDGVDNNVYGTSNQGFSNQVMQPAPDAVNEFRVVTNNQSAEYGRVAGATVNVAYRSGTNRFSGSGWEFFRNTALERDAGVQAGRRLGAAS